MTFRRRLVDALVFEGLIISWMRLTWMKCTGNTHLHETDSAVEVPEDMVPERAASFGWTKQRGD